MTKALFNVTDRAGGLVSVNADEISSIHPCPGGLTLIAMRGGDVIESTSRRDVIEIAAAVNRTDYRTLLMTFCGIEAVRRKGAK